jgi:hypothetical protein
MTKIVGMTPTIPRGTIIGKTKGGPPLSEAEHFDKREACGGWFESVLYSALNNRCRIRPATIVKLSTSVGANR